jgi:hypothetical protein
MCKNNAIQNPLPLISKPSHTILKSSFCRPDEKKGKNQDIIRDVGVSIFIMRKEGSKGKKKEDEKKSEGREEGEKKKKSKK